mmetsp:Transcript_13577/g.54905  ORF Transcript_13577/g.54905 Transcript_13577/m.54905 type:complete len:445 (-) Transcript_13577:106-1440(-)
MPTIATDSTGPRRPVGPLSREDQARADGLDDLDLDLDLDDDIDHLDDDDDGRRSAMAGPGGAFVRAVVTFLALWCWRIAPMGCAWGVVGVDGRLVRSPLVGSPFQWFAASFVVSSLACVASLALVRARLNKGALHQPRRTDGPPHHARGPKASTPTMGGAAFIPAGLVCALVANKLIGDECVLALSLATAAMCVVGAVDDLRKLRQGTADVGLPPLAKLACQSVVASAFCAWLASGGNGGVVPSTTVTLFALSSNAAPVIALRLGRWFWALAAFTMVAESNAVNVTDGLDGLAASTVAFALVGTGMILLMRGQPQLASFAICVAGSACGFLVVNRHPASAFMGDTGSLALGTALGGLVACGGGGMVLPVFVASGVFVVEAVSVLAQRGYSAWTRGEKLLKMSPLHHHLELSGWGEMKIVVWMVAFGAACAVAAQRVALMGVGAL